jgi:hypothetical protein
MQQYAARMHLSRRNDDFLCSTNEHIVDFPPFYNYNFDTSGNFFLLYNFISSILFGILM